MQQPHKTNTFIPIPHNVGSLPDWEVRLGYPQLLNMFVGGSNSLYCLPSLYELAKGVPAQNTRAIHYSNYKSGSYIVVTNDYVLKIDKIGSWSIIGNIKNTKLAVQIDENQQNQIGIVDGQNFYVYDQNKGGSIQKIGTTEGFEFKTPISIVVLNTITVIMDKDTNTVGISSPNNMYIWSALDTFQIQSQLTQAVSLETLSSNLYVFGTTGISRYVPNSDNSPYLFPFTLDVNYRQDIGAIGTNSVIRGFNEIFFLSSKFVPMSLDVGNGLKELGQAPVTGIARIISEYKDINNCAGSFYSYRGNYFYSMTFQDSGTNWTYCQNSNTWSFNEDLIVDALRTGEVAATKKGIFKFGLIPIASKKREWRSARITNYKGLQPYRTSLSGFEARIIQGLQQTKETHYMELTISLDSESWLNTVKRPIGATGKRKDVTTWKITNLSAQEFTFKLTYQGTLDFTIDQITAIIK